MADTDFVFAELILGLAQFTQEAERWTQTYPPGLIHAMNGIALHMGARFPKTFTAFLNGCRQPLGNWYPASLWSEALSTTFSLDYALLQERRLTEPASDYMYSLPEALWQHQSVNGYIPESVMENWAMRRFLEEMRAMDNAAEAQKRYTQVRSFLIEHSWVTNRDFLTLRRQGVPDDLINRIKREFYQADGGVEAFYYCNRCGILRPIDERRQQWIGIKPAYCDDHRMDSPLVHHVPETNYVRASRGIHLRTFIPGQTELALFREAEMLQEQYPGHLTEVTRYPGIDRYDLRLVFRDEVWAIDVKDLADPHVLGRTLDPLPDTAGLAYDQAFYVISDRRLELTRDYIDQAIHTHGTLKKTLHLMSQADFCSRMRSKCKSLVKASR